MPYQSNICIFHVLYFLRQLNIIIIEIEFIVKSEILSPIMNKCYLTKLACKSIATSIY